MPESSTRLERAAAMKPSDFRRHYGVHWQTFTTMTSAYQAAQAKKKKSGRPPALTLEEQILFTIEFFLIQPMHLVS